MNAVSVDNSNKQPRKIVGACCILEVYVFFVYKERCV